MVSILKGIPMIEMNGKQYLTVKEAAELLDVTPARVRHLIYDETLEHLKLGNQNLVTLETVQWYAANKKPSGWPLGKKKDA
jgi:excisionase family DNA binding protein